MNLVKKLTLCSLMLAAVVFTACSSDSDGDRSSSSDYDYISVTIDGKTGREEFEKGFNIGVCGDGKDGKEMITLTFPEVNVSGLGEVSFVLTVYEKEKDFVTMKTGKYPMSIYYQNEGGFDDGFISWGGVSWPYFYGETSPFDSSVLLEMSKDDYCATDGTLTVNKISKTPVSFMGYNETGYTISGSFDCTLQSKSNSTTKKCQGMFSVTYCAE